MFLSKRLCHSFFIFLCTMDLWNYLPGTKSQFCFQQALCQTLKKNFRLRSFQKPQLKSVSIFFKLVCSSWLLLYLLLFIHFGHFGGGSLSLNFDTIILTHCSIEDTLGSCLLAAYVQLPQFRDLMLLCTSPCL